MRAMVYHGNKDLRLETVPEPDPAPGEVKLRVDLRGICATDIEEYQYGPVFITHDGPHPLTGKSLPIVTEHELTGTVVEAGASVDDIRVGDRVIAHGVLSCGRCWWCRNDREAQCPSAAFVGFSRDGGLAEYMTWPSSHLVLLPDHVTSEEAALVEPTSVACHAVHRGRPQPGEYVAVLGVGAVGMLALQVAKAAGARVCAIDRRQMSLDLARELGADATINAEVTDIAQGLKELTEGVGPDIVIDAAGGPDTTRLSVEAVRSGGRVVLVAIYTATPQFDFSSIVSKEIELIGSLAYTMSDTQEAVRLIASSEVQTRPLVSDVIGLDQVLDVGFARMLQPTKDFYRILVAPGKGA